MPKGRQLSLASIKRQLKVKNLDARIHLDYDGIIDSITVGDDRASTVIGPQGDHTSAYALFKTALKHVLDGAPVDDAILLVIQIVDTYSTDQLDAHPLETGTTSDDTTDDDEEDDEDEVEVSQSRRSRRDPDNPSPQTRTEQITKYVFASIKHSHFFSKKDIETMQAVFRDRIAKLEQSQDEPSLREAAKITQLMQRTEKSYQTHNANLFKTILETAMQFFLTSRNKVPGTAYPREGNCPPPEGESARITAALKKLSKYRTIAIAEHPTLPQTTSTLFLPQSVQHARTPSREMLGQLPTGGENFSDDDQGLDTSYRRDSTTTSSSSTASSDEVLPSTPILSPPEIDDIATQMMELLHYPRIPEKELIKPGTSEWNTFQKKVRGSGVGGKSDKQYNAGTKPRDNDIEKLVDVMEEHIVLIFTCFQKLKSGFPARIIDTFSAKVASKWFGDSSAGNSEKIKYNKLCSEMRDRLLSKRLFLLDYQASEATETVLPDDTEPSPT